MAHGDLESHPDFVAHSKSANRKMAICRSLDHIACLHGQMLTGLEQSRMLHVVAGRGS